MQYSVELHREARDEISVQEFEVFFVCLLIFASKLHAQGRRPSNLSRERVGKELQSVFLFAAVEAQPLQ